MVEFDDVQNVESANHLIFSKTHPTILGQKEAGKHLIFVIRISSIRLRNNGNCRYSFVCMN